MPKSRQKIVMPGLPGRTMIVKTGCSVQLMKPLNRIFAI